VRGPLGRFNIVASRVVGRSTVFALVSLKVLPDPSLGVDLIAYRGDTGRGAVACEDCGVRFGVPARAACVKAYKERHCRCVLGSDPSRSFRLLSGHLVTKSQNRLVAGLLALFHRSSALQFLFEQFLHHDFGRRLPPRRCL
jgi:hypothetical protein